jgi:hypothetical protein
LPPVGVTEGADDAGLVAPEGEELGAPLHCGSLLAQMGEEGSLDLRLGEDEQEGIGRVAEAEVAKRDREIAAVEVQPHLGGWVATVQ